MKKLAFLLASAVLSLSAHAQPVYDSWVGVQPAAVTKVAPAAVLSSTLTKLPAAGKTLSASYSGSATANFGYTVPTGNGWGYQTFYTGTATALGAANFKATATSSGATFVGTLGSWRAGAARAGEPAGFNSYALRILPTTVNLSGSIGTTSLKTVGYQRSFSGAQQAVSSTSSAGTRTRDYLPNTLNGGILLNNAQQYIVGATRHSSVVNYKWATTRR